MERLEIVDKLSAGCIRGKMKFYIFSKEVMIEDTGSNIGFRIDQEDIRDIFLGDDFISIKTLDGKTYTNTLLVNTYQLS